MAADCPTCSQRITDEERLIVLLLRAARIRRHKRTAQLAASLAQGAKAPHIEAAAVALGGLLASYALRIELQVPDNEIPAGKAGLSSDRHAIVPFQQRQDGSGHAS